MKMRLLPFACLLLFCLASVRSYTYKYMWSDCGIHGGTEPYYVYTYGMKLYGANNYGGGYQEGTCTAVLQASSIGDKLMIRFTDLDLFAADAVDVYDGKNKYAIKLTDTSLSGVNSHTDKVYRSSGKYLTVVFKAAQPDSSSDGFKAIVTPYETGYCPSWEFECCDGDCIDNTLRWDGVDNCQDSSDESSYCLSSGAIAGIATGAVVGGICLIGFITFCIVRSRRANMGAARTAMQVATVTGYSGTVAQPYYPQQNYTSAVMAPPSYAVVTQQQGHGYQQPPAPMNTAMPQ